MKQNPKKRLKKRTIFTIICIVAILLFSAVCFVFYWYEKSVSEVLIERFFKAFTVELALLFGIKLTSRDE